MPSIRQPDFLCLFASLLGLFHVTFIIKHSSSTANIWIAIGFQRLNSFVVSRGRVLGVPLFEIYQGSTAFPPVLFMKNQFWSFVFCMCDCFFFPSGSLFNHMVGRLLLFDSVFYVQFALFCRRASLTSTSFTFLKLFILNKLMIEHSILSHGFKLLYQSDDSFFIPNQVHSITPFMCPMMIDTVNLCPCYFG